MTVTIVSGEQPREIVGGCYGRRREKDTPSQWHRAIRWLPIHEQDRVEALAPPATRRCALEERQHGTTDASVAADDQRAVCLVSSHRSCLYPGELAIPSR